MKKQLLLFAMILLPLVASAHDIEVKNADGVTIYYNYINDGTELAVTYRGSSYKNYNEYTGNVIIPNEVTYMNRTRKVACIGDGTFYSCSGLTSVTIPNSVTTIGYAAFSSCSGLTSVTIPNSVTSIDNQAFQYCSGLTSIAIGNGIKTIGQKAFYRCSGLKKVIVKDIAAWCGIKFDGYESNPLFYTEHIYSDENTEIKDLIIPNSVTTIGDYAFRNCSALTSITIPNSVTSIGKEAFWGSTGLTSVNLGTRVKIIGYYAFAYCSGLTSVTIPNSVTSIGEGAFHDCTGLTSITIPNSVTSIGNDAFSDCTNLTSITLGNNLTSIGGSAFFRTQITTIISLIENPFAIDGKTSGSEVFTLDTFNNATLYVPKGTINKYKATDGWKDFLYIEEGTGGGDTPTTQKCEKPTISYENGKLTFTSATDGAVCQYSITDTDIKAGSGNEVQLGVTYNISVYATKSGYDNSDVATATLCWIDASPKTEGITNGVAQIAARPVLVKTDNGFIMVEGADDRTNVSVYTTDGKQVGSAISQNNIATIATSIQPGSIAIVKVGDKAVKVIMK